MTVNRKKVSEKNLNIVFFYRKAIEAGFKLESVNVDFEKDNSRWISMFMYFGKQLISIKSVCKLESSKSDLEYDFYICGNSNIKDPRATKFLQAYINDPRAAHLTISEFFMNYVLNA